MPPDQNVVRELVLAELRCASHRCKMAEIEINFIGQGLKAGMLSPADALKALDDTGWQALVDPLIMSKLRAAYIDG
jgi:hypothetical protein